MIELDVEIGGFQFLVIGFRNRSNDAIKFFQQNIWPKLNNESEGYAESTFICDDIDSNILSVLPNKTWDLVFIVADFTNDEELQRAKEVLLTMQDVDKTDKFPPFSMGININPFALKNDLKRAYKVLSFGMDILVPLNMDAIPKDITLNEIDCIYHVACLPIKMSIAITCTNGLIGFDFDNFKDIFGKAGVASFIFGEAAGEKAAFHATNQALDCCSGEVDLKDIKRAMVHFVGSDDDLSMYDVRDGFVLVSDAVNEKADVYVTAVIDNDLEERIQVYAILVDTSMEKHGVGIH